MKIFLFNFSIFTLICCSETGGGLDRSAGILFGVNSTGLPVSFIPFRDQDTIKLSKIKNIDVLGINIKESHPDSTYYFNCDKTPVFNLEIITGKDREHFESGHNCVLSSFGGEHMSNNTGYSLFARLEFPVFISGKPVLFNDTIEISNGNDKMMVSYTSKYSGLITKDSLVILKK